MTPALKPMEHDRNVLLSCILKPLLPGSNWTTRSM